MGIVGTDDGNVLRKCRMVKMHEGYLVRVQWTFCFPSTTSDLSRRATTFVTGYSRADCMDNESDWMENESDKGNCKRQRRERSRRSRDSRHLDLHHWTRYRTSRQLPFPSPQCKAEASINTRKLRHTSLALHTKTLVRSAVQVPEHNLFRLISFLDPEARIVSACQLSRHR